MLAPKFEHILKAPKKNQICERNWTQGAGLERFALWHSRKPHCRKKACSRCCVCL